MSFISRLKDTENPFAGYLKRESFRWRRNLVVAVNRTRRLAFPWSDLPKYVVILQMGKVGSRSIRWLMTRSYGHRYVLHEHHSLITNGQLAPSGKLAEILRNEGDLRLISLTRMPLDHAVSAFFQVLHNVKIGNERKGGYFYIPSMFRALESGPLQRLSDGTLTLEELRELFLNVLKYDTTTFSSYRWFDDQIKVPFGIDVYATPFAECGYKEYRNDDTRLLVMRYELDDILKRKLLGSFYKLWLPWKMPRANVRNRGKLGETYRRFKREVKFPKEYVDRACESRYFKHFYTAAEIEQQRRKWSE